MFFFFPLRRRSPVALYSLPPERKHVREGREVLVEEGGEGRRDASRSRTGTDGRMMMLMAEKWDVARAGNEKGCLKVSFGVFSPTVFFNSFSVSDQFFYPSSQCLMHNAPCDVTFLVDDNRPPPPPQGVGSTHSGPPCFTQHMCSSGRASIFFVRKW